MSSSPHSVAEAACPVPERRGQQRHGGRERFQWYLLQLMNEPFISLFFCHASTCANDASLSRPQTESFISSSFARPPPIAER